MNSQCTCICLVVLKSKKHCVHIHSLNFRRKKIPYKNRRYDNLSLSDLKMFHVITVSSLTDWHLSVEGSVRPDEGWGDTVFGLLVCWPILSQQKVLSFVLLSYSFFVKWIWDPRVIIYPQMLCIVIQ